MGFPLKLIIFKDTSQQVCADPAATKEVLTSWNLIPRGETSPKRRLPLRPTMICGHRKPDVPGLRSPTDPEVASFLIVSSSSYHWANWWTESLLHLWPTALVYLSTDYLFASRPIDRACPLAFPLWEIVYGQLTFMFIGLIGYLYYWYIYAY